MIILPYLIAFYFAVISYRNPKFGIYTFIFLFPFLPIYVLIPITSSLSFNGIEILSLILLGPIVVKLFLDRETRKILNPTDGLILLFIIIPIFLTYFNARLSINESGLATLEKALLIPILPYLAITRILVEKKDIEKAILIFFIGSIFIMIFGYYEYFSGYNIFLDLPGMNNPLTDLWGKPFIQYGSLRIKTSFAHPLSFGVYISIISVALIPFIKDKSKRIQILGYIFLLLLFPLLLLAQARGALLVSVFVLIFYLIRKFKFQYILSFSIIFIIGIALFNTLLPDFGNIILTGKSDLTTAYMRSDLWGASMSSLLQVNLFGVADIKEIQWLPANLLVDIVSWYLESLVFRGLIFFIFHIFIALFVVIKSYQLAHKNEGYYIIFLPMLAFFLNFINVSFVGSAPIVFWVFLALFVSSYQQMTNKSLPVE